MGVSGKKDVRPSRSDSHWRLTCQQTDSRVTHWQIGSSDRDVTYGRLNCLLRPSDFFGVSIQFAQYQYSTPYTPILGPVGAQV